MSLNSQIPFHDSGALSDNPRPIVALAGDYPRGHEIAPHRHVRAQLVYASQGIMTVTAVAGSWVAPPHQSSSARP